MPALLLVLLALLSAFFPSPAAASKRQLTIMQDDAAFLGLAGHDPDKAMADARSLGVDVVRVFIVWRYVSPEPSSRKVPAGFDPADPNSPGYDWSRYDGLVERARRYGIRLYFTLAPPMPYWGSADPNGCPHPVGGYFFLGRSCHWKPDPALFAKFARAVAQRYGSKGPSAYGGSVVLYSIWNEPNLEHYLFPQVEGRRSEPIDVAARRYRVLWYEGWKAIAAADPVMRDRVLYGETAAISSPLDTLYGALCLDPEGRPFRGRLRRLQGCSHPRRLPIGGIAIHPYNNHASGTVYTRSYSSDSHPAGYIPRLHRFLDRAARLGRIPPRRGIFLTEFGFQTDPPDATYGLRLSRHAAALNEADRLYYSDPRVEAVAQFELYDPPVNYRETEAHDTYTTGLAFKDGTHKPSWDAFRMPLVISKLSRNLVEVWGQVRPAEGRTTATLTLSPSAGRAYAAIAKISTNREGYFRIRLRRRNAALMRYRTEWQGPGGTLRSRAAEAGRMPHYLPEPKPAKSPKASPKAKPKAPEKRRTRAPRRS